MTFETERKEEKARSQITNVVPTDNKTRFERQKMFPFAWKYSAPSTIHTGRIRTAANPNIVILAHTGGLDGQML